MAATPDESSSGSKLKLNVGSAGAWLTVELRGELDLVTAATLLDRVGMLIAQEASPRIALDLSQVSFCDSSGINAFVRLWKRAGDAGGELVLLRPDPRLAGVLTTTGLDLYLRVCGTLPAPSGMRSAPEPT